MKLRIDVAELERICADFDVSIPTVIFEGRTQSELLGHYNDRGTIRIYTDCTKAPTGTTRFVLSAFNRTFLHEFRHHWQAKHKPELFDEKRGAYWSGNAAELDARAFEEQYCTQYRVLKVVPPRNKFRSPLSRLSETERKTRR